MNTETRIIARIVKAIRRGSVRDTAARLGTSPTQLHRCYEPEFLRSRPFYWVARLYDRLAPSQQKARPRAPKKPSKKNT